MMKKHSLFLNNHNKDINKKEQAKDIDIHAKTLTWFINYEKSKQNNEMIDSGGNGNEGGRSRGSIGENNDRKNVDTTLYVNNDKNRPFGEDGKRFSSNTNVQSTIVDLNEHNRNYTFHDDRSHSTVPSVVVPKKFQRITIKIKPLTEHPLIRFTNLAKQRDDTSFSTIMSENIPTINFLQENEFVKHKGTCLLLSNIAQKEKICRELLDLIFYSDERSIMFAIRLYQLLIIKLSRLMKNYYKTNESMNHSSSSSSFNLIDAYEFFLNIFHNEVVASSKIRSSSSSPLSSQHHRSSSSQSFSSHSTSSHQSPFIDVEDQNFLILSKEEEQIRRKRGINDATMKDNDCGGEEEEEEEEMRYHRTPKLKTNENYISFVSKTVILQWKIICLSPWGLENARLLQNHFPYHVLAIINLMKDGGKSQIIKHQIEENNIKKNPPLNERHIQIVPASIYTSTYWPPLNDLTNFGFDKKLIVDATNHLTKAYESIITNKLPIPIQLIEDVSKISM